MTCDSCGKEFSCDFYPDIRDHGLSGNVAYENSNGMRRLSIGFAPPQQDADDGANWPWPEEFQKTVPVEGSTSIDDADHELKRDRPSHKQGKRN